MATGKNVGLLATEAEEALAEARAVLSAWRTADSRVKYVMTHSVGRAEPADVPEWLCTRMAAALDRIESAMRQGAGAAGA
jgi:hypothetical protein